MIAAAEQFGDSCQLAHSGAGRPVLYVRGERDLSNVEEITACARQVLCRSGNPGLAIDLAGVSFIDACTIGALIELHRVGRERGCRVSLRNAPEPVHRVLRLIRVPDGLLAPHRLSRIS